MATSFCCCIRPSCKRSRRGHRHAEAGGQSGSVRAHLGSPAAGAGEMPVAERPGYLPHGSIYLRLKLRLIQAEPVPAAAQTRGRTRGARHPDPEPAPRPCGHPRLWRRERRRLRRHQASVAAGRAAAGQRPEKRNVPENRAAAHAPPLRPPPLGLGRAGQPKPGTSAELTGPQQERTRLPAAGALTSSAGSDATPRLSPQTTVYAAPAPDAI